MKFEKPVCMIKMMDVGEVAYLKSAMRRSKIATLVFFILGLLFLVLWLLTSDFISTPVFVEGITISSGWIFFFFLFCTAFGFGMRVAKGRYERDISEMQKEIFTISITKKEVEENKEYEIEFGPYLKDIDVKKEIFNQVQIGDECVYERAKHSGIPLIVIRKTDGLVLLKRKKNA